MSKRLKADLTLLFVAAIWGQAFVAQRVGAAYIGPFLFNGSRFLLAAAALLPLTRFRLKRLDRKTAPWVAAAGLLLCGASLLQQAGMRWTTAGNAGFITGLYVLFVPVLLLIFWRQRVRVTIWVAAFLAVGGIFLLSAVATSGAALTQADLLVPVLFQLAGQLLGHRPGCHRTNSEDITVTGR